MKLIKRKFLLIIASFLLLLAGLVLYRLFFYHQPPFKDAGLYSLSQDQKTLLPPKTIFKAKEPATFVLSLTGQKTSKSLSLIPQALAQDKPSQNLWQDKNLKIKVEARFKGRDSGLEKIQSSIQKQDGEQFSLSLLPDSPNTFQAGSYQLQVTLQQKDGQSRIITQDFHWGVLAINTDRSIYLPGQTSKLAFGVLDDKGKMVCDALLRLQITTPEGKTEELSTQNEQIKVNPECQVYAVTSKPDYEAYYQINKTGVYQMTLTASTKNGIYSISDNFEAHESVTFDIQRNGPTRIYPPEKYPVTLTVTANQDFSGTVEERMPWTFTVIKADSQDHFPNKVIGTKDEKLIRWQVNFKKGQTYQLSYIFKAPEISPEFYLLGPLRLSSAQGQNIFAETRQWQIASDSVATNSPTAATGGWTNGSNAYADGGGAATIASGGPSATETYNGYGFAIDATAIITGVRVRADTWGGNETFELDVSWDGGTTWSSSKYTQALTTGETTYWFDVTSDTAWTSAKLNDTNFRVRVDARTVGGSATVNLDWLPVEVTYSYAVITGNAYADEATPTPTTWIDCDGSTPNINLSANGATPVSAFCNDSTGEFILGTSYSAADLVNVIYLNTNGGDKGAVYFKNADTTSNIGSIILTKNRVSVQGVSALAFTNTNFTVYNGSNDGDIPVTIPGAGAIQIGSGVELHIASNTSFTPGGNVTADNLHLKGTYNGGSETLTLSGSGTGACSTEPGTIRPLCIDGGFFTAPATVSYTGTANSNIEATTYTNLTMSPASGTPTYTLGGNTEVKGTPAKISSSLGVILGSGRQVVRKSDGTIYSIINNRGTGTIETYNSTNGSSWTKQGSGPTADTNDYLFVTGGASSNYVSTVYSAPINSNGTIGSWSTLSSLPQKLGYHSTVVSNGYLFVTGGFGTAMQSTVYSAPINSNGTIGSWSTLSSLPLGSYAHSAVISGGYLFVTGGGPTGGSSAVYSAPITEGTIGSWSTLSSLPNNFKYHSAVVNNGYLFVTGGYSSGPTSTVYSAQITNGTIGSWSTLSSLPQLLEYHSAVVSNGYLFVTGGSIGSTTQSTVYSAQITNGTIGSWSTLSSLPQLLEYHSAVVSNGYLFVTGGTNGSTTQSTVYSAQITNGTIGSWSTLSSLPQILDDHSSVAAPVSGTSIASAIDSTGLVHIIYVASNVLKYITFNTGTNTYGSPEDIDATASTTFTNLSLSIDSADKPHVTWSNGNGGNYYIKYSNKTGAGWRSPVSVSAVMTSDGKPDITIDSSTYPEVSYIDVQHTSAYAAVGDANDATSFGTPYQIDSSVNVTTDQFGSSIAADTSGNTWVAYTDVTTNYVTLAKHASGTWGSGWTTTTDSKAGYEPSIALNGSNIYLLYQKASGNNIVFDRYNGSSWKGETGLESGTYQDVKTKWSYLNDNQGTTQLDYLYSDDHDVYWNKLTFSTTASLTITGNMTTSGSGNLTVDANANNPSINLGGSLSLSSTTTFTKGTGTLNFNGTTGPYTWTDNNSTKSDMGQVAINGTGLTVNLGSSVKATSVNIASGQTLNIDPSGSAYTLTLTGSGQGSSRPLINSGTLTVGTHSTVEYAGTSTTDVEPLTYYNLTFSGSGGTYYPTGSITTLSNLTLTAGTLAGTSNMTVNGNVSGVGTVNLTGGTFEQRVGAAKTFGTTSGSSNWTFNNLTFSNSTGSPLTITTNSGGSGSTIVSGTLQIGQSSDTANTTLDNETNDRIVDVNGNMTITDKGVFNSSSSSAFTIAGNFTNNGTFTANTGTITFDDNSKTSILDGSGTPVATFYNFTSTTPAKILNFAAGKTFRINGLFTITGTAQNPVNINSTTATQWLINHQGTENVTYAFIANSGCAGGTTLVSLDTTDRNGGNVDTACWGGANGFVVPQQVRVKGPTRINGNVRIGD